MRRRLDRSERCLMLAGLIYGGWVDGASVWVIGLCRTGVVGLLTFGLHQVNKRKLQETVAPLAANREDR